MSRCSTIYDIVRVDGSSDTVAVLLRRDVKSPCTIACPLCISSSSASYRRCPVALMFCMHLMLVIRCVWHVTYVFNVLPAPRVCKAMMSLMSCVLETYRHVRG
jgi:hypothetical protein